MRLIQSFPLIPCEGPLWAPDRHSQTIFGDILPSKPLSSPGSPWILDLPDGDQLALRVHERESPWITVLFHGLTGSADAKYMHRVAHHLLHNSSSPSSVVLMNHRNCGEGWGLARSPYHSGRSDDLGFVISQVRKRWPHKKVLAVGFSMSANALLLLMSRVIPASATFSPEAFAARYTPDTCDLPDAAITVNAPIHLESSARLLSSSLNRLYELSFINSLKKTVNRLSQEGYLSDPPALNHLMSVRAFDDLFTAPRSGFASGHEYYENCSARTHLNKIDRPTVCLTAANDPFVDHREYLKASISPFVRLHIEAQGGHMGYLHKEKTPLGSRRWLDYGVFEIARTLMRGD